MEHESGATVSNLWTSLPSDDDEAQRVRFDVPRNRDEEFTSFVRDTGAYLHRTAYLLCGDPHRAEELVQSTFERVYRTWSKVRPGTGRAYARRILVNLRIDSWRHGRRESFPGDDKIPVAPTSDHAGRIVLRDELVRGLAQLSPTQRRVVVLRHLLDLPEKEVARELGLAVGTVKAANSRGLARLRDLLLEGAETIEPVAFDGSAVLDRSRAALRRRRVGQGVGAACAVLLLALGVVTRGPVPLPVVGPVVLPGGQLIAPLFDPGPTDALGPDVALPGNNTPVACPEEVPEPTPTRPAEAGDDLGPLDDPLVVDAADARPLTCYDVGIDVVTRGSIDAESGLPVTDDGEPLAEPRGLSDTAEIWRFDSAELYDDSDQTNAAHVETSSATRERPGGSTSLTWYQETRAFPTDLAVTGGRVVWSEYTAADTSPRMSFLRTLSFSDGTLSVDEEPLIGTEERLWLLAATQDHALWTAGVAYDDTRLYTTAHDDPNSSTELATGVTALAADDDEAVAAVLSPGGGETSTTEIRLFDDLAGEDVTGTTLFEVDHDSSAEVTAVAVSDDAVAWAVVPTRAGSGASTLYVVDRADGRDSVVELPDRGVDDLRASGGLISWTSTDTAGDNPVPSSYLYRATPSASGYDGPDLARFPGDAVTASVAGDRTAWLETRSVRQWLVEGTVSPSLERD
ncbi:SigE family RNA polymerase sigma factor [Promicromonospora vindobonensis]|uniref:SigE family RNA polymerase sigma factor n=1 Tax=Promicromonospora vindobonensis TaxID=195748 RepID=A0ABW5VRX7_9MICO